MAGARRVRMTAMPQMVALFNGMGGGAAGPGGGGGPGTTAAGPYDRGPSVPHLVRHPEATCWAAVSVIIGSISFSGSLIAFAKYQKS